MLKAYEALLSIHLVEERVDDEFMDEEIGRFFWRWTYPSIDNDIKFFLEKRLIAISTSLPSSSMFVSYDMGNFFFYKLRERWIYILQNDQKFSFILLTKDFYPNHYQTLLNLFTELFQSGNSIGILLDLYLTLMITDRIIIQDETNNQNKKKVLNFYNENKQKQNVNNSLNATIHIRSIIKLFSLDVILIYTALLLKKRIIVYHHDQRTLFDFVMALPYFVPHRSGTKHTELVPNVDLQCPEQINDLKARNHYISTFNDPRIEEHEDLYDVYINLAAVEITISHKAKETFMMTKTHKDVAMSLVRVVEKESTTDEDVINEIIKKTNELLNILHSLAYDNQNTDFEGKNKILMINKKKLKEKLSSPNLEQFFWNLALAEGLTNIEQS